MTRPKPKLSRREQEVIYIVYARGHATAAEVREAMQDAPTDAAVRTTLRILLGLVHQDRGRVEVLGHEMPRQQAAAKQHVGFASEDLRLYPTATLAWHMDFVRSIARQVTVLHEGRVLAEGEMEQVQNDPKVIEVYLGA